MSSERWVRRMWKGRAGASGHLVRALLWPAELLFRVAVRIRNLGYDSGVIPSQLPGLPAVSVGNLTVGGTGKTPVSAWVVSQLLGRGARVALVARGYGRDELLLHARWNPAAPVIASPDRVAGVQEAVELGCDVVVLDDAFQHRRLARTLDIVLVAAETPLPGALLPRGPYREGSSALRRADLVVVTRKSSDPSASLALAEAVRGAGYDGPVARVHLQPARFERLDGSVAERPEGPVGVFTGVADPTSVQRGLESVGIAVSWVEPFPDHHEFTLAEIDRLRELSETGPIVVTEKDAVKLESLLREPGPDPTVAPEVDLRVLCLTLCFEAGEAEVRGALDALGCPKAAE